MLRMKTTLAACLLLATASSLAADAAVSRFFGYYEGVAISQPGTAGEDELQPRDLTVKVGPYHDRGFTVSWTTVIRKGDGRLKRSENSVNFEPAKRHGVYGSAMRRNMFGEEAPMDPLKGEPFVWATVAGDTMTVHSLIITEDGGYEMQSYERHLTDDGMSIEFRRVRDGESLRAVTGELRRTRAGGSG